MNKLHDLPGDPQPTTPPVPPTTPPAPTAKKEHLSVEIMGGFTIASAMVSALSMWYVFLVTALPLTS